MPSPTRPRILVAPLDWGLGHATRCVPVVRRLKKHGFEPVVAGSGRTAHFFAREYPDIEREDLFGYGVRYSESGNVVTAVIRQFPSILQAVRSERVWLDDAIDRLNLDGVISDNRFGLASRRVPCVFMTHQIDIKSPVLEGLARRMNRHFIGRFDQCWVPDYEGSIMSGELSYSERISVPVRYVGPLSRFERGSGSNGEEAYPPSGRKNTSGHSQAVNTPSIVALVSGPEPQRTMFSSILQRQLAQRPERSLMLLGQPEMDVDRQMGNCRIVSHLETDQLAEVLRHVEVVVSRSGYSTVMDLAVLDKKALFVPTPGQTEQEYLAERLDELGLCAAARQEGFDLERGLARAAASTGLGRLGGPDPQVDWETLLGLFR